jgi:hypothetical protein
LVPSELEEVPERTKLENEIDPGFGKRRDGKSDGRRRCRREWRGSENGFRGGWRLVL